MTQRPLLSVVSPVYGCRNCLEALAAAVASALDAHAGAFDWELVLVDDRSPDEPWPVIEALAASNPRIRGVRLTRNHGQHLAIWAGLAAARGDWVAVIDCDLQDDPSIIPELFAKALQDGTDAVIVDRGEWSDTAFRRAASKAFYRCMELLGKLRLDRNIGNFGLYSRRLVDILLQYNDKEVFLPVMVALTGLARSTITVDRTQRHAGSSSYNFMRLLRVAVAIVIRFSDRPLKLSVLLGALFCGSSVLISLLLMIAWLSGAFMVPGWTSLMLSLWFLAGLILGVLGIHGIYLGRIFTEVQDRPRILIDATTDAAAK